MQNSENISLVWNITFYYGCFMQASSPVFGRESASGRASPIEASSSWLGRAVIWIVEEAVACITKIAILFLGLFTGANPSEQSHRVPPRPAPLSTSASPVLGPMQIARGEPLRKEPPKTFLCKQLLTEFLKKSGETIGTATDRGDCFHDAIRIGLEQVLHRPVTVKELRTAVAREVARAHEQDPAGNWIREILKRDKRAYRELLELGGKTAEELQGTGKDPLWGRPEIEGQILADAYNIQIKLCVAAAADVDAINIRDPRELPGLRAVREGAILGRGEKKYPFLEKLKKEYETPHCYFTKVTNDPDKILPLVLYNPVWEEVRPKTGITYHTIKIALYPGHFVPVLPIPTT